MCVQGITGGDGKEELPAASAATGMAKGEGPDPTRGPGC